MLKEVVEIAGVYGDKVKIKFTRNQMCSCCRMQQLCGGTKETLTIDNCGFKLNESDKIEITIDEKKTMLANIIIFLVPGIIFILGLVIFKARGEVMSFFLALILVCIYYVIVKLILRKYGKKFDIKIIRKL